MPSYVDHLVDALVARDGGDRELTAKRVRQIREVERDGLEAAGAVRFDSLTSDSLFIKAGSLFVVRPNGRASRREGEGFAEHTYGYGPGSLVLAVDSVEAAEEILGPRE